MTGPLRVSFLTSARSWRGSCVSLSNIAAGLIARGHQAQLLVGEFAIAQEARARGVPATVLPLRDTNVFEVFALRRALREFGGGILVADRPRDLRLAGLVSLGGACTLVYRYNLSRPVPPGDPMTRFGHRRTAMIVFRTEAGARNARERAAFMARRPWRVISGGVDLRTFHPDPEAGRGFRERHALGGGPVVIAVGAFEPVKRWPEIFDVVAALGVVPLIVCGAGREQDRLKRTARGMRVDARFVGLLEPDELRGAYNAADCLIHLCEVETFGLSIAEAMACGRPVAVADGGAMAEVVGDDGLRLPPHDTAAFARGVGRLLADGPARARLGQAGLERSVARFSMDRVVDQWEDTLLQLPGGG